MDGTAAPRHLDEGMLLHLVDRDVSAWELDQLSKHVIGCESCSEQLALLQRRSDEVSGMLGGVQVPNTFPTAREAMEAGRRRGRRRRFSRPESWAARAAVIAAVLVLSVSLVPPLRAWVADQVGHGWALVQEIFGSADSAPPSSPVEESIEASSAVWFSPAGAKVVVSIVSAQAGGTLRIELTDDQEGSLEVMGGATEMPLVTEREVRVLNTPASTASYLLTVPRGVQRLEVRLGQETLVDTAVQDVEPGLVLDLAR